LARAGVYRGDPTPDGLRQAAASDDRIRAMLTNTISATTVGAGMKHNVIPARAEATLDIRLLPGVDPADFQAELAQVIDDPGVRIEQVHQRSSDANPFDTELFRVIEEVIHDHIEDAVVVPSMGVGFTDSAELRNLGLVSYGFSGNLNDPELSKTVHGHNERVSLDSFRLNCRMVYDVTRRMCAARSEEASRGAAWHNAPMARTYAIDIPYDAIAEFCRRNHIRKLSLFGSVLRDDFTPRATSTCSSSSRRATSRASSSSVWVMSWRRYSGGRSTSSQQDGSTSSCFPGSSMKLSPSMTQQRDCRVTR
jgi:hypothetical protein